jgi:hypothetical protein
MHLIINNHALHKCMVPGQSPPHVGESPTPLARSEKFEDLFFLFTYPNKEYGLFGFLFFTYQKREI